MIVAEDCRLEGINLHRDLTVYHEEPQAVGDLRLGAMYFVGGYLAMIEQLGNELWGSYPVENGSETGWRVAMWASRE